MPNDSSHKRKTYPVLLYVNGTVLVFGGGAVGMRKAVSLARHGLDVTVIDREHITTPTDLTFICEHVDTTSFSSYIGEGIGLVVCALSDAQLNSKIAAYCRKRNIPVNVATSRDEGTVAFPAILESGSDTIAVSSRATCPQCSYALKRYIKKELPNISIFSSIIHELYENGMLSRDIIKRMLDDENFLYLVREGDYEKVLAYTEGNLV